MKHEIINECAKNHIWLSQLNSQQYEVLEKLMEEYAQKQVKDYHSQPNADLEDLRNEFIEADVEGEFDLEDNFGYDRDKIWNFFLPYLQKHNVSDYDKPTWKEVKEIIESQLSIGDNLRYSNYNKAGLIATELQMKFNVQYFQKQNESDAVEFGLWLSGNYDTTPKEDAWMDNDLIRTTQELYKEFLNSKTK